MPADAGTRSDCLKCRLGNCATRPVARYNHRGNGFSPKTRTMEPRRQAASSLWPASDIDKVNGVIQSKFWSFLVLASNCQLNAKQHPLFLGARKINAGKTQGDRP